jgi:Flp pilus assembly protein protease CpaA
MKKFLTAAVRSTSTTVTAVLVLVMLLAKAMLNQMDDDPATVANWNAVADAVTTVLVAFGLFASRAANKSSQDSGIRD